jgi:carboxymethylenebutenolidase
MDRADPREISKFDTSECETLPIGFLARPRGGAPAPGIAMIPDVWGLSDHYRDLAQRLAAAGFATLAIDLYRREPRRARGEQISDPGRWIRGLSDPAMLAEVQAAIDHLASGPAAGRKIGVLGFCMGGQYALLAAAGCTGLSAAVPFYGMLSHEHGLLAPPAGESLSAVHKPRSPLAAAADVRCPVLALFGCDDPFIPIDDVRALAAELAKAGAHHVVSLYAGAGHAFLNETRPEMYRPAVAREAWQRALDWFRRELTT